MKLLRYTLIFSTILLTGLIGLAAMAGYTPGYLLAAPGVGTGAGAKLLCSARYVSGLTPGQAFDDLVQYSPILANLTVAYDDAEKSVTTSLFGVSETTASYLPGLGCAIDFPGYDARGNGISHPDEQDGALWPAGDQVLPPRADLQALLERQVAQDNQAGLNTRALLVARQGQILAEAYDQGADASTPLLGWSMSKSLNSIMLANLDYRGLLDLTGRPGFPEWADDERSQITLEHMLTMTDGLSFSEEYDPGDDATAMLFTEPSPTDYVLGKSLKYEPGSHYSYSSGTANLLSRVYFNATGASLQSSYSDFMENIYTTMGFDNATFEVDATGIFMGSSYFYATARDWARIGQMMLNGGVINGHRLVTEDWIRRATSPNNSENERAYGYQWWLNRGDARLRWPDLPEYSYAAQGNRQQWMMVIPSRNTVIVRLGWTAGRYPVNDRFAEILNAL